MTEDCKVGTGADEPILPRVGRPPRRLDDESCHVDDAKARKTDMGDSTYRYRRLGATSFSLQTFSMVADAQSSLSFVSGHYKLHKREMMERRTSQLRS